MRAVADIAAAIRPTTAAFVAAFAGSDAAGVAALYTVEGQLFPPDHEVVTGRAGIEAFWKSVMAQGVAGIELEATGLDAAGELAAVTGRYVMRASTGSELEAGKYLVVFREQDDRWFLHRDIWNPNPPEPAP